MKDSGSQKLIVNFDQNLVTLNFYYTLLLVSNIGTMNDYL